MKTFFDIDYCGQNDPMRKLDMFLPDGSCRAAVLWAHGGGLEAGSRKGFDGIAKQLTDSGIAFLSIEYRMFPNAAFPDFIVDCAEASAWAFRNAKTYGLGDKIFFGGSSAGGYITLMLCFARKYALDAGIRPEDFAGFIADAGQPTTHYNILKYRGEDPRLCRLDEAAPLWHVCGTAPDRPLKLVYASDDLPARPEQNILLYATLEHFGYDTDKLDVSFMNGYGHCGYCNEVKNGRYVLGDLIGNFVEKFI